MRFHVLHALSAFWDFTFVLHLVDCCLERWCGVAARVVGFSVAVGDGGVGVVLLNQNKKVLKYPAP